MTKGSTASLQTEAERVLHFDVVFDPEKLNSCLFSTPEPICQ